MTEVRFKLKDTWKLLKISFKEWKAKDPFRQSAVIAYYAIFSLPALLVLIITLAGLAFDVNTINDKVMAQVSDTMGSETAGQVREMLKKAKTSSESVWAMVLGVIVLVTGATGVFVELQKTLNMIWKVKEDPKSGIWATLKHRLFSFGIILAIAFLLLVSLVISTALAAFSQWLQYDGSKVVAFLMHLLDLLISLVVISLLFALMFKILPDAKIKWRDVWVGSVLTALLFIIGKTAIAFYFGQASPGSGYGAAGSIVLILLWVSYSSMILFLGAEFTHAYSELYSGEVQPTRIAKRAENISPENPDKK